ncbi:MAG: peptidoglycan DD-metalloendopeptidase family protein [Gammaproteobacteria bacterium]|nr:peptidoglycan DD-metalloendopeptidase family protein [Gammaproteobacteria bacterium]
MLRKRAGITGILMLAWLITTCGNHVYHRVKQGDTLYSIGWQYGYDYRQVAEWNNIRPPYAIHDGQWLRVAPSRDGAPVSDLSSVSAPAVGPAPVVEARANRGVAPPQSPPAPRTAVITPTAPVVKPVPLTAPPADPLAAAPQSRTFDPLKWLWPTQGAVLSTFSGDAPGKKGLDIGGRFGQPILAAAPGRVVYGGSGLVGYGNLVIIKHDDNYLTAYAHNNKLHVREGEQVTAGQRIADMGKSGAERVMLHFEMRFQGKPVDPLRYLTKSPP